MEFGVGSFGEGRIERGGGLIIWFSFLLSVGMRAPSQCLLRRSVSFDCLLMNALMLIWACMFSDTCGDRMVFGITCILVLTVYIHHTTISINDNLNPNLPFPKLPFYIYIYFTSMPHIYFLSKFPCSVCCLIKKLDNAAMAANPSAATHTPLKDST